MQTKFKKHQEVILKVNPGLEFIEYHNPEDEAKIKEIPLKAGMRGKINMILPNGQYHVAILDEEGNIIAYCPMNEEDLKSA